MKLILKQAKIIDKDWNNSNDRFDISIRNGKIERIAPSLEMEDYKTFSSENLHVSIGFMDIGTQIGEPGLEHRENIDSIISAAAAGGFTAIAPFPNTQPAIHSKSEVQFIVNNTKGRVVEFFPVGALSKSCAGEDITEILDMHAQGAIAFSDGKKSVHDSGLMLRALQYVKACNGLVINRPDDKYLAHEGQVHEGIVSVSLGLEGLPEIAESLGLSRDITLNAYAESRYCAYNISTSESIRILKKAKSAETNKISATVAYLNLILEDRHMTDFDVNLKVLPPLRDARDRRNLLKALREGHIDAITSGHTPLEEEKKKMSFAYADFGAIGIETVFAALLSMAGDVLELPLIIEKLSVGPRNILGLPVPEIAEGAVANLCIFDPDITWEYKAGNVKSLSMNSPFLDQKFKGKVLGIINQNKFLPQ